MEIIEVDEINHLPDVEQAETIADHISSVSQEYEHLKKDDIIIPQFPKSSVPHITVEEVKEKLMMIKAGDIPAKLIKVAADQLAVPLANVINASIRLGQCNGQISTKGRP